MEVPLDQARVCLVECDEAEATVLTLETLQSWGCACGDNILMLQQCSRDDWRGLMK